MIDIRRSSAPLTVLRIVLLALAYAISGKLSLMLAIPPGFVTGLFLPMGIALGAVLLWGLPLLAGVFIGSTLLNVWTALVPNQSLSFTAVVIAMEIAVSSSLAVLAGALLIRHFVGFPDKLTDEKKIFAFFILGGPAATSISASCGVLVLYFNQLIHFNQLLFTWWTWWIGDAIGVLIATPLMCVFFAEPQHFWRSRRFTVGVPIVVSSVMVLVIFIMASSNEQKKLEDHFKQQATLITGSIESSFAAVAYSLSTLRGLFIASDEVTREEFTAYVRFVMPQIKGVSGFSWNQYVKHEQRQQYEQQMREQGFENFHIQESGPDGSFHIAPEREDYIVITYIEPWLANMPIIGINAAADSMRLATQIRARDTGQLSMTGPLQLFRDKNYIPGVIVFYPVYKAGHEVETAKDRQAALMGFATAIVRIRDLIPPAMAAFDAADFELKVFDITDTSVMREFYSAGNASASAYGRSMEVKNDLLIGGRVLAVSIFPTEKFLLEHRSLQSWFVLAGGLLFCSFLGGFLLLITGRTQHVRDLVEQRTKELAAILENAVESILVVDHSGRIQKANPAAEQLFGCKLSQYHAEVGDLVPSLHQYFSQDGYLLEAISWTETVGIRNDGSELPIELSLSPVVLSDRKFFTVIVHDATAKRKVDRLKNEFISTVSHELRTPLTSIRGALGIVLSGDLGQLEARSKDLLVIANNNADRLTRLVNDILDIDKLEFGNAQLNNQQIAIAPLLEQAVLQNQGYGARYGVELILEAIGDSLRRLTVKLDPDRFIQVMSNLLSNAIKYSHLGGVVKVKLEQDGPLIRVSVIDRGQGIPASFRQQIFRKFAQVDSSDTRRRDGTGLGLSITKAIVERFGGQIDYHSIEGEGTTFYFTLPIQEVTR